MKKRYIINGYLSYTVLLKDKGKYLKCPFEGGAVSGFGSRAASYTTGDKNIQELLENSKEFKCGMVKVAEVYGEPEPEREPKPEDAVNNLQMAKDFLLKQGAAMEELQTKAQVLETARKMGFKFENWK